MDKDEGASSTQQEETKSVSGGSGGGSPSNRPRQISGNYPMRQTTYYQFSSSDIRSIGVAQAASTVCFALGTFALSAYLDFGKDIKLSTAQPPDEFLVTVYNLSFWAWVVFWGIAIAAFLWQGSELRRIKAEHGDPTLWNRFKKFPFIKKYFE